MDCCCCQLTVSEFWRFQFLFLIVPMCMHDALLIHVCCDENWHHDWLIVTRSFGICFAFYLLAWLANAELSRFQRRFYGIAVSRNSWILFFLLSLTMFMRKQTWRKHDLKRFHINSTKQSFRQNMWRFELVMLWYIGWGWIQVGLCTAVGQNSKPYPPSIKFGRTLDIPWFLNILHSCYQCKHLYVKAFAENWSLVWETSSTTISGF
jgi:hypothetical protein